MGATTDRAERRLRGATAADGTTLIAFNAALARESEGKELDPAALAAGVRALLADPAKGFYTVAEERGEVVGQCLVTFEWSDWRNGWFWWVQSVYVRADARRTGVFRSLFDHLTARAAAQGDVIGLRLYVERGNAAGKATYRALGMEEEPYDVMGLMFKSNKKQD